MQLPPSICPSISTLSFEPSIWEQFSNCGENFVALCRPGAYIRSSVADQLCYFIEELYGARDDDNTWYIISTFLAFYSVLVTGIYKHVFGIYSTSSACDIHVSFNITVHVVRVGLTTNMLTCHFMFHLSTWALWMLRQLTAAMCHMSYPNRYHLQLHVGISY